jgi:phosphoserine phosphatase
MDFLYRHGEFAKSAVAHTQRLVEEYRTDRIPYSYLADEAPRAYARGLAGLDVLRHEELANSFVRSPSFHSRLTNLGELIFSEVSLSESVSGVIITGAPTAVLEAYAPRGVSDIFGVEVEVARGRFTGALLSNPASRSRKNEILLTELSGVRIAVALGDSSSDIPMLEASANRIVVGSDLSQEFGEHDRTLLLSSPTVAGPSLDKVRQFLRRALS